MGNSVVEVILVVVRVGRLESTDMVSIGDQVAWGFGSCVIQAFMFVCWACALIEGCLLFSIDDVVVLVLLTL